MSFYANIIIYVYRLTIFLIYIVSIIFCLSRQDLSTCEGAQAFPRAACSLKLLLIFFFRSSRSISSFSSIGSSTCIIELSFFDCWIGMGSLAPADKLARAPSISKWFSSGFELPEEGWASAASNTCCTTGVPESSIECRRSLILVPMLWRLSSERLDFSLLALDDFRRGFSNMSGSTIFPHYFLISLERFEIVTLKEYLGYRSESCARLWYVFLPSGAP